MLWFLIPSLEIFPKYSLENGPLLGHLKGKNTAWLLSVAGIAVKGKNKECSWET